MEPLQQEERDDVYQARSLNTAIISPPTQHHNRHNTNHHRNPSATTLTDTFSIDSSHYDEQCGWSQCKPSKIQKLNNPKWFLFFLAVFSVSQSMIVNGFTNVGLGTLEKQFKLSSKQSGMIVAAKEISSLLLIAFLSFYGSFGHKPKYLGYGAIMTACGSMLYVLPHALVGTHIPKGMSMKVFRNQELCSVTAMNQTISEARCEMLGNSEWYYIFVFIGAKLLIGAGTAPLFTLGTSYLDENVKPKVAPVYLGIWYACTSFGPGIGFVAGGTLLNVYVDLIQPPGFDLTPDDPRWIGAWWLGHFFGAILIFMSACALLAYPRSMPGAREMRQQAIREGTLRPEDSRIQGKIADIIPATLTLFKNMTFMFNTLALTATMVISTGLGPFVVKYLQAQFGVSTMKAGIASGTALIPGTTIGIFLGSYLMRRMKAQDTCEGAARYCFIFQVLAVFSVSCFLITGCDRPSIVGIHSPYMNSTIGNNVTSACNLNCACNGIQFEPVCGVDNRTYYSPCHMGCSHKHNKTYASCRCLDHRFSEWNSLRVPVNYSHALAFQETGMIAKHGECDRNCENMVPFLCAIVVLLILNFVNAVPGKMVVMRCVPDNERAYALGVQWIVLTLLGAIPGPLLFGIFIDKTCDLWEETCHGQGNCLVYNNKKLSYRLAAAIFIFEALAAICYFISWKCYKPDNEKELDKKLDYIFQHGGENEIIDGGHLVTSPSDDDLSVRYTGPHHQRGGPGGPSDPVDSPDLTITTELSGSCLSIAGIGGTIDEVR